MEKSIYLDALQTNIERFERCDPNVDLEAAKWAIYDALHNIDAELRWQRRELTALDKGLQSAAPRADR